MSRVVITGAGGGAPNRLEINDFVRNDKYFSLYIQALQLMYTKESQTSVESFFQLGGIHGLPYTPWDGATGSAPFNRNAQWGGYCVHGSTLFPTWHRPYMMLYEQILQKRAAEVAAKYTVDKPSWVQAATQLRQPYWDWARNAVPPAQVISLQQVSITGPDGKKVTVPNPLYHYTFHPIDSSFYAPYNSWPVTHRQPSSTSPNATDDVARLTNVLRRAQGDITSSTYSMLTRVHTWPAFSSHTVGDGGSSSNSLEAVHDSIHVYVGGAGHMSDPAVAAFDPIFFLHHCNVDRLLSLWFALNPTVWVTRGDSQQGSFTLPAEAPVDGTTPLTPFWNSNTTFWASNTQDTTRLGYTYPEFNGLNLGNQAAVRTAIGGVVNRLYGPGRSLTSSFTSEISAGVQALAQAVQGAPAAISAFALPTAPAAQAAFAVPKAAPASPATPAHAPPPAQASPPAHAPPPAHETHAAPHSGLARDMWDWTARIEFKKYELSSSFSVLLFLGAVPEDPHQWLLSPNFVGSHSAFVNSAAGHCANCRNQSDLVEEGFVHLDTGIVEHSGLTSLEPEVVEPYLKANLHWRVQKVDGSVAELASLEVAVLGTELSYPPGSMFPVPGEPHRYHHITHGRPGGSRHA